MAETVTMLDRPILRFNDKVIFRDNSSEHPCKHEEPCYFVGNTELPKNAFAETSGKLSNELQLRASYRLEPYVLDPSQSGDPQYCITSGNGRQYMVPLKIITGIVIGRNEELTTESKEVYF